MIQGLNFWIFKRLEKEEEIKCYKRINYDKWTRSGMEKAGSGCISPKPKDNYMAVSQTWYNGWVNVR